MLIIGALEKMHTSLSTLRWRYWIGETMKWGTITEASTYRDEQHAENDLFLAAVFQPPDCVKMMLFPAFGEPRLWQKRLRS